MTLVDVTAQRTVGNVSCLGPTASPLSLPVRGCRPPSPRASLATRAGTPRAQDASAWRSSTAVAFNVQHLRARAYATACAERWPPQAVVRSARVGVRSCRLLAERRQAAPRGRIDRRVRVYRLRLVSRSRAAALGPVAIDVRAATSKEGDVSVDRSLRTHRPRPCQLLLDRGGELSHDARGPGRDLIGLRQGVVNTRRPRKRSAVALWAWRRHDRRQKERDR